ncbi:hypothetical protein QMK33_18785 [Hymenobacter sp. H14-R3]|uniref:hypothetical protein n=1 Tax=Hymenobacter sp. H14-R3 TaxID=3046308 RepID=UPI0024B91D54|nr:hypothetical protein [Hymenobacter sp. H14-R3]MDJ0367200.1 hypothetical protein [Hymenobacter sp. H14-R3]
MPSRVHGKYRYQAEFKRILNEEVSDYAAWALGLLAQAIQAKGLVLSQELLDSPHKLPQR